MRRALSVVALAACLTVVPPPASALAAACGPVIADPLAEAPWPLTRLRPDRAWPLSTGDGVRVAVIDSGVSTEHAALTGKVLQGTDFVTPGGGNCDENGHGTLIAGIIAGRSTVSNGYAFHGVAPGAQIIPVRVLRDQSRSFNEDLPSRIAAAVRWAADVGRADVMNLSLTTTHSPELEAAIGYAVGKGVVLVAAAGNEGASQPGVPVYPASYEGVIAVASVDRQDKHVGSSVTGSYVDIAAPGVQIAGPSPAGGGYLFSEQGGTSFAAAYVSGVAALIRAYDPALTPQQVAQRITQTADHPAEVWNPVVGYGVVNPQRAVGALTAGRGNASASVTQVQAPQLPDDPLRQVRLIAGWSAVGAVIAAALTLLTTAAVRRGRRRGWRPTRTVPD
jgi:type VII secretion-associated serine protease mycosin